MWIRSSDKMMMICPVSVDQHSYDDLCIVATGSNGDDYELGTYSSVQRVIEIMDEIESHINLGCKFVYQMPQI